MILTMLIHTATAVDMLSCGIGIINLLQNPLVASAIGTTAVVRCVLPDRKTKEEVEKTEVVPKVRVAQEQDPQLRIQPICFWYGTDETYVQALPTYNIQRLCGNGTKAECDFLVTNWNMVLDPTDGKVKDPVKGTTKKLWGYYSCVHPVDRHFVSNHKVSSIGEYQKASFKCPNEDEKTI